MIEKFESLGVSAALVLDAKLSADDLLAVYEKCLLVYNCEQLAFKISESWQLQLFTGDLNYFALHANKIHDNQFNLFYYAAFSANVTALDWCWSRDESLFEPVGEDGNRAAPYLFARLGWADGIKWLHEHLPDFLVLEYETDVSFLQYIIDHCPIELLDYLKINNRDVLLQKNATGYNLAHMAAKNAYIAILNWIKTNEEWALQEIIADKKIDAQVNIAQSAALSGKKEALDFCYDYCKDFFAGASGELVISFAISSLNPEQVNHALSLSDTPWQIKIQNKLRTNHDSFLKTLSLALNDNITLQSVEFQPIDYTYPNKLYPLFADITEKLTRNIQIKQRYNTCLQAFILLHFGRKQESSGFHGFIVDIVTHISNILFNLYVPEKKHLLDHAFFAQARKNLRLEETDAPSTQVITEDRWPHRNFCKLF